MINPQQRRVASGLTPGNALAQLPQVALKKMMMRMSLMAQQMTPWVVQHGIHAARLVEQEAPAESVVKRVVKECVVPQNSREIVSQTMTKPHPRALRQLKSCYMFHGFLEAILTLARPSALDVAVWYGTSGNILACNLCHTCRHMVTTHMVILHTIMPIWHASTSPCWL